MLLEEAVDRAGEDCISENILVDFLLSQKAEVKQMSFFEYEQEKLISKIKSTTNEDTLPAWVKNAHNEKRRHLTRYYRV